METKKGIEILWALAILSCLSIACTGLREESKHRCPDCGVLFKVETTVPITNPVRY